MKPPDQGRFRMPVQWVNRPNADFRGYAGTVLAGRVRPGDAVRILPSGAEARVAALYLAEDVLSEAVAEQAITLTLDREVDASRGDLIVAAQDPCEVSDQFDINLVWMDEDEGYIGRSYWVQLGSLRATATITDIKYRYNINTLEELSSRSLSLNDIGRVHPERQPAGPF